MLENLPILEKIEELKNVLRSSRRAVLSAPPGAGKSTLLPQSFLNEPWLASKKILMLQPRRAAARAVACRIAELLGEEVGETVGWRVRGENKTSPSCRIEVVTEGILTRQLQNDPELRGVGMIVFDEFHERNLHSDLGLALTLEVQEALRDDLRLLVMSATLDVDPISKVLGDAPLVNCPSRVFPIQTIWSKSPQFRDIASAAAKAAFDFTKKEDGGILIFMPGAREINEVSSLLRSSLSEKFIIAPLYGSMSRQEQDAALRAAPPDKRKIVIATNIAETSLTIEGIRIVIDSGYARKEKFDPSSGISTLQTVRISKASAEQRRGRAGRTSPGICLRLWNEIEHNGLADFERPEILEADLTPLALELALWGTSADKLKWVDAPPVSALSAAHQQLLELGISDMSGKLTSFGRKLAGLPVHPRLGVMIVRAAAIGLGSLGAEIATILEERDIMDSFLHGTDLRERVRVLRNANSHDAAYRRIFLIRDQLLRAAGLRYSTCDIEKSGLLCAFAYPDRIGRRRSQDSLNYLLSGGRGARFERHEAVNTSEFITVPRLDGAGADARVMLAAPIDENEIREHLDYMICEHESILFDEQKDAASFAKETRLGAVILKSSPLREPSPELLAAAMIDGIRKRGLHVLPWDKSSNSLRERVIFAHRTDPVIWPDYSDEALLNSMDKWLLPFLDGIRSIAALKKLDMRDILKTSLGYELYKRLEREVPEAFKVPTGSMIYIDYSGSEPELPVRVQEMFGSDQHPSIMNGRLKLRMRLLSPAMRPIQITSDLPTFWKTSWELVKKDMKGRYPKHFWPDDPANSDPTRRAKPRGI